MTNKCPHCSRTFVRKHNFDKHLESCKFTITKECNLNKELEDRIDIPNYKDLYNFVMNLSLRVKKLEDENFKLKGKLFKLQPIEWLNENKKPLINFDIWYKSFNVSDFLSTVFTVDLNTAVVSCIYSNINDESPIFSFDNKKNQFYIFNNDDWYNVSTDSLDLFINHIANLFIVEFTTFIENNDYLINNPKYIDQYISYQNKIYGSTNLISRNQKIKTSLYEKIKANVSSIQIS
jgi:hypothetical protein